MTPNGDTEWSPEERKAIKEAFAEIDPILQEFAARHGLELRRYYHGWPAWDFYFRRKIGGDAYVGVLLKREEGGFEEEFEIHAEWYYDDYDTKRRYSRSMKPPLIFPRGGSPDELLACLEKSLATIDSWELGQWDEISPPVRHWRRMTREEFENKLPRFLVR